MTNETLSEGAGVMADTEDTETLAGVVGVIESALTEILKDPGGRDPAWEALWMGDEIRPLLAARDERIRADEREKLAAVEALAEQWNATPDYATTDYDRGRVDQRHAMTAQLLGLLAREVEAR